MSPDRMTHKSRVNADAVLVDLGGGVFQNNVLLTLGKNVMLTLFTNVTCNVNGTSRKLSKKNVLLTLGKNVLLTLFTNVTCNVNGTSRKLSKNPFS